MADATQRAAMQAERKALETYLKECDDFAIVPDVGGAWAAAWRAARAENTTPTLREAAQQALEALESLQGGCTDSGDGTTEAITVWCPEVITALRAALAEQAAEQAVPVAWREHVEQRLHQWRASTINADGDRVSLSDYLSADALDDLIDYVCDEWFGPAAPPAPARQEPLTEEQIKGGLFHAIDHATVYEAVAFKKGVRFAERALGITAAPAEGGAA